MFQVTNYGICGECKHHKYDRESDGSWYCNNDRSDYFGDWTEYTDRCDEWESKEQTMSRYIEFNDAVKVMACEMYAEAQSQGYDVDGIEDFMPEAKAWLNDAPSIDIVRCKECKYWEKSQYYQEFMVCTYVKGATFTRQHDDFCSRGEREGE